MLIKLCVSVTRQYRCSVCLLNANLDNIENEILEGKNIIVKIDSVEMNLTQNAYPGTMNLTLYYFFLSGLEKKK